MTVPFPASEAYLEGSRQILSCRIRLELQMEIHRLSKGLRNRVVTFEHSMGQASITITMRKGDRKVVFLVGDYFMRGGCYTPWRRVLAHAPWKKLLEDYEDIADRAGVAVSQIIYKTGG